MPVLMLVVAVVILAGVVVVASGRGGEMAYAQPDYPPIDLGPVTATDVALLRPPSAAWGYNMRVTDEALEVIARAVTERDVQIAALQQEVSDLREQLSGRARPPVADPERPEPPAQPAQLAPPAHPEPPAQPEPAPGAAAPVAVTRPQPIYRDPADADLADADPADADPADADPGDPRAADAHSEEPGRQEAAAERPAPEPPAPGWAADPADTSPDAMAPVTGAGDQAQDQHQDQGQDQDQRPDQQQGAKQASNPGRHDEPDEFSWDEDPHQTLVWGAADTRAKVSRAAEETLPNAEQREDGRG